MKTAILFTEDLDAARLEIRAIRGQVLRVLNATSLEAALPAGFDLRKLRASRPLVSKVGEAPRSAVAQAAPSPLKASTGLEILSGVGLGATLVDGGRPYVFQQGAAADVTWWSGSKWSRSSHPKQGLSIHRAVGAITVDKARPYLFGLGNDGHLWSLWWSGSAWAWDDHDRPFARGIAKVVGVTVVEGGRPYVFVIDGDDLLWVRWWSESAWAWSLLTDQPGGFGASMGVVTVDRGHPFAFILRGGGALWTRWYSGPDGWAWGKLGTPPGVALTQSAGTVAVDNHRPYVFALGGDGNLWVCWASAIYPDTQYVAEWKWSNQGHPPGTSIVRPLGATVVDGGRPYVFVACSDGNLWVHWWSGAAWAWSNQGHPAGIAIKQALGVVTVDGTRPYVFVAGDSPAVWSHWWTGSAWRWDPLP
ncbi:MAG: hypothetical protein V4574_06385 [Pseudomonadota bacterium]